VIVGGEDGGRWLGIGRQLRAALLSPFLRRRLGMFVAVTRHPAPLVLKELAEQGNVTPVIDRRFPLADAAAAIRHLKEGHPLGKVVLTIDRSRPGGIRPDPSGPDATWQRPQNTPSKRAVGGAPARSRPSAPASMRGMSRPVRSAIPHARCEGFKDDWSGLDGTRALHILAGPSMPHPCRSSGAPLWMVPIRSGRGRVCRATTADTTPGKSR
jgi:hypothetical protein